MVNLIQLYYKNPVEFNQAYLKSIFSLSAFNDTPLRSYFEERFDNVKWIIDTFFSGDGGKAQMFLSATDFEKNINDSNFTGGLDKEQIKRLRAHLLRLRDARDFIASWIYKDFSKMSSTVSATKSLEEGAYVTLLQTTLEGLFPLQLPSQFSPSSAAFDSVLVPEEDLVFGQKRLLQTLLQFLFLPLQPYVWLQPPLMLFILLLS